MSDSCDPWTVALQVPLSMGFPRQEYWSGLPLPSPGNLPSPGIEFRSPALQADSLLTKFPGSEYMFHKQLLNKHLLSYGTFVLKLCDAYENASKMIIYQYDSRLKYVLLLEQMYFFLFLLDFSSQDSNAIHFQNDEFLFQ